MALFAALLVIVGATAQTQVAQAATSDAPLTAAVEVDHTTAAFGSAVTVAITVTDGTPTLMPDIALVLHLRPADGDIATTPATDINATTGPDGRATVPLTPHAATWYVSVTITTQDTETAPVTLVITPALVSLSATTSAATVVSRAAATLKVHLQSPTAPIASLVGAKVIVSARTLPDKAWHIVAALRANQLTTTMATAQTLQHIWRPTTYRFDISSPDLTSTSTFKAVNTRALLKAVVPGRSGPRVRYPIGAAPSGNEAHPTITMIPNATWASMVGISWRPGCLGRAQLRLISVNYWGLDGYSYRGQIIVRHTISSRVAGAFSRIYLQHFRIRSMFLPDRYGRGSLGPGADDYASMAADNTSGFNCRYTDGGEYNRNWSPHSAGIAIDVNPWENPYSVGRSQLPDRFFAGHRSPVAGVFSGSSSAAVRDFTTRGANWGGTWSQRDYQHFQW